MKLVPPILSTLAILALSACSMVQLAYDNAPRILLLEMDSYLDLDSRQREQALAALESRMARHRRVELPRYAALLGRAETTLADGATREELEALRDGIVDLYREAMRETIPALVPVLTSLDEAQIDHLAARLEEKNLEFAREHAPDTLAERMERRRRRSVETIEGWTGPLRPAQVALVEKRRAAMPIMADDWLAYHRRNQQRLIALLRAHAPATDVTTFLDAWWVRLADPSPDLAAKLAESDAAWISLLIALDRSLDETQRRHVLARLQDYREEIEPLLAGTTAGIRRAGGGRAARAQGLVSSRMRLEVSQRPPPRAWMRA